MHRLGEDLKAVNWAWIVSAREGCRGGLDPPPQVEAPKRDPRVV